MTGFTGEAAFTVALGGALTVVEDFESTPAGGPGTLLFPLTTVSSAGTTFCPNFFGLIDPAGFTSVTFTGTNHGDGIYFDRLRVSDPSGGDTSEAPEPRSYAMVLGGLGALIGFGRCRK